VKVLFFHANRFGFVVESPSERLGGAAPEEAIVGDHLMVEECLVVLFHVEEHDGDPQTHRFLRDIWRVAHEVGEKRLVVAAFGHLSDSYAPASVAMETAAAVVRECRTWEGFDVYSSPFGHNKTFELSSKGHPGAIRHREY